MGIENIMYFALGLLIAGLVALIIMPAVWKRAVRLTKRRIEAATPITLAEFRADKDQLRAEFALATRRLEMTIETLRARLAAQLGDTNQSLSDVGALREERDELLATLSGYQTSQTTLETHIAELEQEATHLADELQIRQTGDAQLASEALLALGETEPLSGIYAQDVERILMSLDKERQRAAFLEDQAQSLLSRLEAADQQSGEATTAIAEMRSALASQDDQALKATQNLVSAEARIASAESRLNAILAETEDVIDTSAQTVEHTPAETREMNPQLNQLRNEVLAVQSAIEKDWVDGRADQATLRQNLTDIAINVSQLAAIHESEKPTEVGEEVSLFDRVQRFADDGLNVKTLPVKATRLPQPANSTDRIAARREIRGH
ncbi:hypothetical protein PSQ90_11645 [Devosia rhodophyticola]|uniref:Uncharacterized protein n=1 Tax=Devosia rhodophyticola TaxID=3026423 RepID=A0ABY7YVR6_9HYPH|nr:hypothetical protein [Devosia rhodophyticola]WDR04950.1 hypothetical protein PSQ90_11645 [Devosia rhodophyticola]